MVSTWAIILYCRITLTSSQSRCKLNGELIPYMTAIVATHALLLSLGGPMAVSSIRALAQIQQQEWEAHIDAKARKVSFPDPSRLNKQLEGIKQMIARFMQVNLFTGVFGIIWALVFLLVRFDGILAQIFGAVSFFVVAVQAVFFSFIVLEAMRYVRLWVRKPP